jgi:hypothetical protein
MEDGHRSGRSASTTRNMWMRLIYMGDLRMGINNHGGKVIFLEFSLALIELSTP